MKYVEKCSANRASQKYRHTDSVHLSESGSVNPQCGHTLSCSVQPNDGGLKRAPFELGDLEGNVFGSGGKVAAVVAASIPLPPLIALVPGRLGLFLRLGLQQFVEGFLDATSYQLFELPP